MSEKCISCDKTKSLLVCGCCQSSVCKNCAQFLAENQFSFLENQPDFLKHSAYCPDCYHSKVQPELDNYDQMMSQAKEILIFNKTQGKETRYIKRTEKPVKVLECTDYDETVLRLAFFAVQKKFNALVDLEITEKKVKTSGYQSTVFSGIAVPAHVTNNKLVKDRSIWQNPN